MLAKALTAHHHDFIEDAHASPHTLKEHFMATVRDLLAHKGSNEILSISPSATVFEAAERMNERKVGALVVLVDERLVGIITERDILQKVVALRRDPAEALVEEVMTS